MKPTPIISLATLLAAMALRNLSAQTITQAPSPSSTVDLQANRSVSVAYNPSVYVAPSIGAGAASGRTLTRAQLEARRQAEDLATPVMTQKPQMRLSPPAFVATQPSGNPFNPAANRPSSVSKPSILVPYPSPDVLNARTSRSGRSSQPQRTDTLHAPRTRTLQPNATPGTSGPGNAGVEP